MLQMPIRQSYSPKGSVQFVCLLTILGLLFFYGVNKTYAWFTDTPPQVAVEVAVGYWPTGLSTTRLSDDELDGTSLTFSYLQTSVTVSAVDLTITSGGQSQTQVLTNTDGTTFTQNGDQITVSNINTLLADTTRDNDSGVYNVSVRVVYGTDQTSQAGSANLFINGTGSQNAPYLIKDTHGFSKLSAAANTYSKQIADLEAPCEIFTDDEGGQSKGNTISPVPTGFSGSYDGGNYIISRVKHVNGMFGTISAGATVKNLKLKDVSISFYDYYYVGAITNKNYGTIENCEILFDRDNTIGNNYIFASYAVGGIVGENYATVDGCTNNIYVTSNYNSRIGGIAGYNAGTISNSVNNQEIKGNNDGDAGIAVGGIVGYNDGTIKRCFNNANVKGASFIGGIVGETGELAAITQCGNTGSISGTGGAIGGVVGLARGKVESSYNKGDVTKTSNGNVNVSLPGWDGCYSNAAGGLVGFLASTLSDPRSGGELLYSYNTGKVSGINAGGLYGESYGRRTDNCYSSGQIEGSGSLGLLVGLSYARTNYYGYTGRDDDHAWGQLRNNVAYSNAETDLWGILGSAVDVGNWYQDGYLMENIKKPTVDSESMTKLNSSGDYFQADSAENPINNGYPILVWEAPPAEPQE